jgi:hypothetical protein
VAFCHCGRRRWRLAFQSWRSVVQARATENARYDGLGLEAAGRTSQFLVWLAANFSRETANGDREFNKGVTSQRVVQAIQTFGDAPRRRGGASAPYIQEMLEAFSARNLLSVYAELDRITQGRMEAPDPQGSRSGGPSSRPQSPAISCPTPTASIAYHEPELRMAASSFATPRPRWSVLAGSPYPPVFLSSARS